jgi:hypothetical protein
MPRHRGRFSPGLSSVRLPAHVRWCQNAVCTYVDPSNPNRVGLSMDVADMDAFQAIMGSEAGAEAMKYDGVRPETLVVLVAS